MDMEPTYFLFSGKLFHAAALEFLPRPPHRGEDAPEPPGPPPRRGEDADDTPPQPHRGEDPGPEGYFGEPVGEDEDFDDENEDLDDENEDLDDEDEDLDDEDEDDADEDRDDEERAGAVDEDATPTVRDPRVHGGDRDAFEPL